MNGVTKLPAALADVDLTTPQVIPLAPDEPLGPCRAAFVARGRVRFVWKGDHVEAMFRPGETEAPIVALATIARTDARGLEAMVRSCLPHVDEIVLGIDGRSDEATKQVAKLYADRVYVFNARDIDLTDEEWADDEIHFGNARNIGRAMVRAPWTLVLDADERLARCRVDLRRQLAEADPEVGAFEVAIGSADFSQQDAQRLARTQYRFRGAVHNQLPISGLLSRVDASILHDLSLRDGAEQLRRVAQRNAAIEKLREPASEGDLSALFHLAKHQIGMRKVEEAERLVQDYRFRTHIHGELGPERVWLAVGMAATYLQQGDLRQAELWAVRTLMDGPSIEAFCILGDIAEDEHDFARALNWYEVACSVDPVGDEKFSVHPSITERWNRRAGLRGMCRQPPLQAMNGHDTQNGEAQCPTQAT